MKKKNLNNNCTVYSIRMKTVRAIQYTGNNKSEIFNFTGGNMYICNKFYFNGSLKEQLAISYISITSNGEDVIVNENDWIVEDGLNYKVYDTSSFLETYENIKE